MQRMLDRTDNFSTVGFNALHFVKERIGEIGGGAGPFACIEPDNIEYMQRYESLDKAGQTAPAQKPLQSCFKFRYCQVIFRSCYVEESFLNRLAQEFALESAGVAGKALWHKRVQIRHGNRIR